MEVKFQRVDPKSRRYSRLLLSMHRAAFPDLPMVEPIGDWWLAKCGTHWAGFCVLWPSVNFPLTGYLARSVVVPKFRGRGIQKRMIRVREAAARRHGWLSMVSDSNNGNCASGNSLIACGYRMWVPEKKWGNETSIYWRRALIQGAA